LSFRAKPPLGTPLNPYHLIGKHCIGAWLISEKGGLYLFDSSIHKQLGTFNTLANLTWTPRGILTTANTTRIDIAAKQSLIDLPTTYNFTVVFSARATAHAAGRAAIGWGGTDDLLIYPYDNDSGNGPRVFWRDVGGSQININDGNPPVGDYHQFTYVSKASNDHRLYVDGVEVGTSSDTGTAGPFNSVALAGWKDASQGLTGYLEYAYIFDRALTPYEIASIHQNPYQMFEPVIPLSFLEYEAATASYILTANININLNCNITISAGRAQ